MIRVIRLSFALALTAASLFAGDWKPVGPGIDYQEFTPKAPSTYHVARVDLSSGQVRPIVSSERDRGLTVSRFASRRKAIIAVNGDYFDPQMMPIGLTIGPCGQWKARSNTSTRKEMLVAVAANKTDILEPAEIGGDGPEWSDQAISGWPVLVRGCKALSDELPGSASFTQAPHARTAIGTSADHKTLFIVVADGQKDGSAGVSLPELAAFMQGELQVCEAVNLDGGGSSAMTVRNKLVTSPTDGVERPVANHFGIILTKDYEGCPAPSSVTASKAARIPAVQWWRDVEEVLGRPGTMTGDVFRVTYPRSDLSVTLDGVTLAPQLALTSWVAFRRSGSTYMMMSDLVLTESEVSGVLEKLREARVEKTSLHNHLLGASPATMYLHVAGHAADPTSLAHAVRQAIDETATPIAVSSPPVTATWSDVQRKSVEAAMRVSGKLNGPVLQLTFARTEKIAEHGMTIPPAMGVATAINLQTLSEGRVAATGDFVLLSTEVDKVVNQLTKDGVHATAIHNHMLAEQPRLTFVHFWVTGEGVGVAKALRRALDLTNAR